MTRRPRAALSRLTRNGLLVTSKTGRRTFPRLSSRAAAILDDGARRIFSFGAANQPWDGMWRLVAFSIPEDNRSASDALRKQLRWLGFAPLYDGLWVSPRDHAIEVIGYLKDLDITTAPPSARPRCRPNRRSRPGPGTWRAALALRVLHRLRQPASGADPRRAGVADRRAHRQDPGHGRVARVPGPGSRPARRAAPARRGRGLRRASCSSGATICSARWPRCGSARSSPDTAPNSRPRRLPQLRAEAAPSVDDQPVRPRMRRSPCKPPRQRRSHSSHAVRVALEEFVWRRQTLRPGGMFLQTSQGQDAAALFGAAHSGRRRCTRGGRMRRADASAGGITG